VAELLEVLDRVKTDLTIGDMHITVLLLNGPIDENDLEDQVVIIDWLDRTA
jgi:hypothetical protein